MRSSVLLLLTSRTAKRTSSSLGSTSTMVRSSLDIWGCRRLSSDKNNEEDDVKEREEKKGTKGKDAQKMASRDLSQSKEAREKLAMLLQRQKSDRENLESKTSNKGSDELKLAKPKKFNVSVPKVNAQGISEDLKSAANAVASSYGKGDPGETLSTRASLLQKLSEVEEETNEMRRVGGPMGKKDRMTFLLSSMPVEKNEGREATFRPKARELTEEQMRFIERRRALRRGVKEEDLEDVLQEDSLGRGTRRRIAFDLRSGVPLNIFDATKLSKSQPSSESELLKTWQLCEEREKRILRNHPPRNAFEDMAQLTEEGKLWHFPINNEQGLDEDNLEPFYDHVFLEHHLESWCPKSGPVRQFMELVCFGMQKNPYISVEKKLSHIAWFKEYFNEKEHKQILYLSGALNTEEEDQMSKAT